MTQADERILEFLREKDIIASPAVIAANNNHTAEYISQRYRKFSNAGLLRRVDASKYWITELGERFLRGEVGADDISLDNE